MHLRQDHNRKVTAYRKHILLLYLLFIGTISHGQREDFGTWSVLNVKWKSTRRWNFDYSNQLLTRNNSSQIWMIFHDLSANHRITRDWTQEFHLRWIHFQTHDQFQQRQMMYYVLQRKFRWGLSEFSLRSRWQYMAIEQHWDDGFAGPYFYHRIKANYSREISSDIKLSASIEAFQPLNRPNRSGIDQLRYGLSVGKKWNSRFQSGLFFQRQEQIGRKNPWRRNFIGYSLTFTI